MEQVTIQTSRLKQIKLWFHRRYRVRHDREGKVTRMAAGAASLFSMLAMAIAIFGIPTGLGTFLDMLLLSSVNVALMIIVTYCLAYLFSMFYLPLPRRLLAIWTYIFIQMYIILYLTELGVEMSLCLSLLYSTCAILFGFMISGLISSRMRQIPKIMIVGMTAAFIGVLSVFSEWPTPEPLPSRSVDEVKIPSTIVKEMTSDPSVKGDYKVQSFNYGSGNDKHRSIFGNETDVLSTSVDASKYITEWSKLKKLFWGFDERAIPINGRVWMPVGEGEFPLVLIVHGNHLMEYFSDGGYSYLGELLASRGMIAVSVDANFFNFSVWSSLPNDDMKMRAWLMLKHLQHFQNMDIGLIANNPLQGRVDWAKVALIGHSRGGQAVAMAADKNRWFAEDKSFASLDEVNIESVVAIAPTDKVVDDKSANLSNINYLTIQGARDADVNVFYGDRQYNRTTFSEQSEKFKASLYIGNANHSQFNADWGRMDERLPGGILLNNVGMLEPESQRQIAKVYISAFLEATLHNKSEYKALFQDYRSGAGWLPDTKYVGKYEGAEFKEINRFESSNSKLTTTSGIGFFKNEIVSALDRDGNSKGTKGVVLQWDKAGATYEIQLTTELNNRLGDLSGGNLVFSIANMEWELLASYNEETNSKDTEKVGNSPSKELQMLPSLPELEIVITNHAGQETSLNLNDFMPVQSPMYASFLSMGFLEHYVKDNKYKHAAEAAMHTYIIPVESFIKEGDSNAVDTADNNSDQEMKSIVFRFKNNLGKVMIDDIGFMPQGGSYVEYN